MVGSWYESNLSKGGDDIFKEVWRSFYSGGSCRQVEQYCVYGIVSHGGFQKKMLLSIAGFWGGLKKEGAHSLEYILGAAIGLAL